MPRYCLDTNIFIEANNGPYSRDFHPSFWKWLDEMVEKQMIFSSTLVYDELVGGGDELSNWVKKRKDAVFFEEPDGDAQEFFTDIADYVMRRYPRRYADLFLSGADPWLIAQSKVEGAIVVTHEKLVPANSQKPKIPNISQEFGVDWRNLYEMMRELGAKF